MRHLSTAANQNNSQTTADVFMGSLSCLGLDVPTFTIREGDECACVFTGKLDLYCAAAGFHPGRVMPCVIDVGTDNEALRNDPMYMGLQHPRLQGDAYYEVPPLFRTSLCKTFWISFLYLWLQEDRRHKKSYCAAVLYPWVRDSCAVWKLCILPTACCATLCIVSSAC